ncbi:hypothetical protein V8E52_003855 [Russula decolorans]
MYWSLMMLNSYKATQAWTLLSWAFVLISAFSKDASNRHWVKSTWAIFLENLDIVETRVVSGLGHHRRELVL